MRSPSVLIGWLLLLVLLFPFTARAFENSTRSDAPSIAAQPNDGIADRLPSAQPSDGASVTVPARQPGLATTLEIAPQPQDKAPAPDGDESGRQRAFRQSREDEIARLNRNFHPHDVEDSHRPYIGIDLEYTTQCYLGMEEHGFEVVSVYPNSPAARAGLIGRTGSTPKGDLAALGSILAFPVGVFTYPLLRDSGALGTSGDFIIAVDDVRVHDIEEYRHIIGHLKPGDTVYLTVIRPLRGGYHRSMRVRVHIDNEADAAGNIIPAPAMLPHAAPSVATESAAN